ncbi:MAG: hypothetical protein C4536_02795 [Actinobacteria bacterium]|nr:MAG: hypothetical protein C4536_02795 [Actinomycetota bacterium]
MKATAGSVVCERSMYGDGRNWAHDSVGVTAPATDWYLAEGASEGGFETFVLVQNPGSEEAYFTMTYMTGFATLEGPSFTLAPGSRITVRVNDAVTTYDVSTTVKSNKPVVVERAVYLSVPAGS